MYHTRIIAPDGMITMPGYTMRDEATGERAPSAADIEITPEEGHALVAYLHSLK